MVRNLLKISQNTQKPSYFDIARVVKQFGLGLGHKSDYGENIQNEQKMPKMTVAQNFNEMSNFGLCH